MSTTNLTKAKLKGLHVTEGIGGTWHYHLSLAETNASGLCGAKTMLTSVPMGAWGLRGHLNERYCPDCAVAGVDALRAAGAALPA